MRIAERAPLRLAVFVLLATITVWPALGRAAWVNEFRDAQVFALHEHAAVDTVLRDGQLPLWDPYYCGGLYGLGAPQSRWASPFFALSLIFGPERADVVVVFLLLVVGMEGTYRWLRLRVADASAAMRIAPIFALSGYFAVALFRGWTSFFGFELLPVVLWGVTRAAHGRIAGVATASIAFAVMLGFGGAFAAPLVAVAAVVEAARALFEVARSRRLHAVGMLVVCASFMLTVAAFRLVPMAETLAAAPRLVAGTPGHQPKELLAFLVGRPVVVDGDVTDAGAFRVGWAFLLLVGLGGAERRVVRALLAAVVFVWLAAGYARTPALFAALRALPVLSALRYPERFLWIAILFALEPAANTLARVPRLGDARAFRRAAGVALTMVVAVAVYGEIETFARLAGRRTMAALAPMPAPTQSSGFRQSRGNRWLAAHVEATGTGSLSCWETHPVRESSLLRADLAAEEYLADPAAGSARRVAWSPGRIDVHVALARPARLLVNQNWHPGWRASAGAVAENDGLLAVDLPAGERDVVLAFRPMSAIAGAAVSAVAVLALAALALRARRGRRPRVALVAAPWLVLAAFEAAWTEPRFSPPPQANADGSPAIVEAPPAAATRIDAALSLPLALEAARVSPPDAHGNVLVELWLRRTGPLAREDAVLVDIGSLELAHEVVGGSFYLADAPRGALVHDAFGVHVATLSKGTYDVFVSFGHVSRRRGGTDRVRIATLALGAGDL